MDLAAGLCHELVDFSRRSTPDPPLLTKKRPGMAAAKMDEVHDSMYPVYNVSRVNCLQRKPLNDLGLTGAVLPSGRVTLIGKP
jgi:hypothetical protein